MDQVNASIRTDQILHSNNFNEFASSIKGFSFSGGELMVGGNNIILGSGILNGKTRTLAGVRSHHSRIIKNPPTPH